MEDGSPVDGSPEVVVPVVGNQAVVLPEDGSQGSVPEVVFPVGVSLADDYPEDGFPEDEFPVVGRRHPEDVFRDGFHRQADWVTDRVGHLLLED